MKPENYDKIKDLMSQLDAFEKQSHKLAEAKYNIDNFSVNANLKDGCVRLYIDIETDIMLEAVDMQISRVVEQMDIITKQLDKL